MIKVYGSTYSRASQVMFALELLGVEYQQELVAVRSERSQSEAYRALNPLGKIPTLQDGELVLWETQAILFYLAQKYGNNLLWADTPEEVAEIYRWSLYASNQIEVPALDLLLQKLYPPAEPDQALIDRSSEALARFLPALEERLEGREFVALSHLTVADIHASAVTGWAKAGGYDFTPYKNICRWLATLSSNPALKKVMETGLA